MGSSLYPVTGGASGTVWQGHVRDERAAVKVSHPDCPSTITGMQSKYSSTMSMWRALYFVLAWARLMHVDTCEVPCRWLATSLEALPRLACSP